MGLVGAGKSCWGTRAEPGARIGRQGRRAPAPPRGSGPEGPAPAWASPSSAALRACGGSSCTERTHANPPLLSRKHPAAWSTAAHRGASVAPAHAGDTVPNRWLPVLLRWGCPSRAGSQSCAKAQFPQNAQHWRRVKASAVLSSHQLSVDVASSHSRLVKTPKPATTRCAARRAASAPASRSSAAPPCGFAAGAERGRILLRAAKDHGPRTTNHGPRNTEHESRITKHETRITTLGWAQFRGPTTLLRGPGKKGGKRGDATLTAS